jgi:hypothetical protein
MTSSAIERPCSPLGSTVDGDEAGTSENYGSELAAHRTAAGAVNHRSRAHEGGDLRDVSEGVHVVMCAQPP